MTDETRAQEEAVTTQPAPMPSADQTSEVAESQPVEPQAVSDEELKLPAGVSERTAEQFEKLKTQLAELKAQQSSKAPKQQSQVAPLYDPTTGYVDVNELEGLRQVAIDAQTQIAELKAEREKEQEEAQTKEVLSTYPELDPESKGYNRDFYKATRAVLLDSRYNPDDYGGKSLTYKQAADIAKSMNSNAISEAEKVGAEKALTRLSPKEQASLEATGRSDKRVNVTDDAELVEQTRKGNLDAIIARMKRT